MRPSSATGSRQQREALGHRAGDQREERDSAERFLKALGEGALTGNVPDIDRPEWSAALDLLTELSRARTRQGFSPSETATFVFSLKQPLFDRLRQEVGKDAEALAAEVWAATRLLDRLGLHTTEIHQKVPRGGHRQAAAGAARAVDTRRAAVGRGSRPAAHRHARQRTDPGGHGESPPEDRRDRRGDRDHRHHRGAHRRHAGRPASLEDGGGRAADGRRLHHQWHPSPDCPDDRPPRRRSRRRDHQGLSG